MGSIADIAIIAQPIKPKFLEEVLGVLGSPNYIILRVPNKEYKIGGVGVGEGYVETSCTAENPTLLNIYRGRNKKCSLVHLEWHKHQKSRTYPMLLSAKFTPYKFDLSINRGKLSYTYTKLTRLIDKYKVPNSIMLLHEHRLRVVKPVCKK